MSTNTYTRRWNHGNEFKNIKNFQADLVKAIEGISKKYNVLISFGNISYNDVRYKTTLTVSSLDETGNVADPREVEWKYQYDRLKGLYEEELTNFPKDPINKEAVFRGIHFIFKGIDSKKSKQPLVFMRKDNGNYCFFGYTPDDVLQWK